MGLIDFAAARFDEAVVGLLIDRHLVGAKGVARMGHAERMKLLASFAEIYDRPSHFEEDGDFFERPAAIAPRLRRVRAIEGGEVIDATWPSALEPFNRDVAERYRKVLVNETAAARFFFHDDRPRPAAIILHGYRCGEFAFEERAWPTSSFFARGLDLAFAVAPFHAVRGVSKVPPFPSSDPRITVEGFRHFIHDLRALVTYLLDRGAPSVGVMGMSLGGYSSALLATIDDRLSFAFPIIPLASFADLAVSGGRLVGSEEERRQQYAAVNRVHRVVSPLARPPLVSPERALVLAFRGDRITPLPQSEKIAAHFGAELGVFSGGHLLQVERGDVFRAVLRRLGKLGLLDAR